MSNTMNSPNMNLPVPEVNTAPGPEWANDINNCMGVVDQHNHSAGSGVQINPSGININAELTFQSQNATNINSTSYVNGGTSIPLCGVYVSGGDLYYNNSGGTPVKITSGGNVNAGAGSITGLPSGTASVTFSASTYVFQSATLTPASLDAGSVIFRNTSASSNGVTVSPVNALASSYNLFWPTLPVTQSIMTLDSSGNMAGAYTVDGSTIAISGGVIGVPAQGITATQIANGTVTTTQIASHTIAQANLALRSTGTTVGAGGVAVSAGSGVFATLSTSFTQVTNLSVTITTTGRPVQLLFIPDPSLPMNSSNISVIGGGGTSQIATFAIFRNGSQINQPSMTIDTGSNFDNYDVPPGALNTLDVVAAGTYTYALKIKTNSGNTLVGAIHVALVAYEI